ncbi:phiSA1p31-related protein [Streptomyces sp. NPDC059499]|uniref:phiSA1p31-related protein n=1 Tax=Streptomyces sp. NPDC059499 TaxID=3346852 RepID=UPI00368809F0
MTTTPQSWVLDGTEFDLTRTWIDVYGRHWEWTGGWDQTVRPNGTEVTEPLMRCDGHTPIVLSLVYDTYGPLIPAPRETTHAERCAALAVPVGDDQADEDQAVTPKPTPRTFAAILRRLRGRGVPA